MKKKYKTYKISCGKCGEYVLTYHKYGAGKGILRLYLAHIVAPSAMVDVYEKDYDNIKALPNLACPACKEVLGVPALSKSQKWVYRMRQSYFHRKLQK